MIFLHQVGESTVGAIFKPPHDAPALALHLGDHGGRCERGAAAAGRKQLVPGDGGSGVALFMDLRSHLLRPAGHDAESRGLKAAGACPIS